MNLFLFINGKLLIGRKLPNTTTTNHGFAIGMLTVSIAGAAFLVVSIVICVKNWSAINRKKAKTEERISEEGIANKNDNTTLKTLTDILY